MTDVTFHVDETLWHEQREALCKDLLAHNGIVAAASHEETPHLVIIEYDPDETGPESILEIFKTHGVRAQRLG